MFFRNKKREVIGQAKYSAKDYLGLIVNEDAATLFEIAYITDSHLISNGYFKPDSINKTYRLKDSGFAKQLNELLQNPENIMAAHNAQSKVEILK